MRGRSRCGALLPLLGLLVMAVLPPLCTFSLAPGRERYDTVDQARTDGTLFSAIAMETHRRWLMRVDYDEQGVRDAYRALAQETPQAASDDPPNIIVVLSESFADEGWLRQYLDLNRELTPFYNRLTESCRRGKLYVPKLGGGTSETEFEVLTGLRSQYVVNPVSYTHLDVYKRQAQDRPPPHAAFPRRQRRGHRSRRPVSGRRRPAARNTGWFLPAQCRHRCSR